MWTLAILSASHYFFVMQHDFLYKRLGEEVHTKAYKIFSQAIIRVRRNYGGQICLR